VIVRAVRLPAHLAGEGDEAARLAGRDVEALELTERLPVLLLEADADGDVLVPGPVAAQLLAPQRVAHDPRHHLGVDPLLLRPLAVDHEAELAGGGVFRGLEPEHAGQPGEEALERLRRLLQHLGVVAEEAHHVHLLALLLLLPLPAGVVLHPRLLRQLRHHLLRHLPGREVGRARVVEDRSPTTQSLQTTDRDTTAPRPTVVPRPMLTGPTRVAPAFTDTPGPRSTGPRRRAVGSTEALSCRTVSPKLRKPSGASRWREVRSTTHWFRAR
jgi:hypothetical protein